MRIDKLLWFLRLTKSRRLAQGLVDQGHIRLNARRVERPAQSVNPGDTLVLPLAHGVIVIEVLTLPGRCGPLEEARSCYRMLDETAANPIAAVPSSASEGNSRP